MSCTSAEADFIGISVNQQDDFKCITVYNVNCKETFIIHCSTTKDKHLKVPNKYHIDTEGNIISKSEPWHTTNQSIDFGPLYPIVINSEVKSFIYGHYFYDGKTIDAPQWILSNNGTETLLKQYTADAYSYAEDIAISHNTIGVVMSAELSDGTSLVGVYQFDLDGNRKLNMTLNFKFKVTNVALVNIADGGFILTVGGTFNNGQHLLNVLKISADRKISSVKDLEGDDCDAKSTFQLFKNEPKEYCVAFLCTQSRRNNYGGPHGRQFIKLLIDCYTDDLFTVDDNYTRVDYTIGDTTQ
ncbi:hypothetical protein TSAR_007836 [Trichomalopsis sarcophagae]|uniref:Uncharacterized protein n=1 Tax=Trichomalopsis sarcophagae TaxID=543379 RepID=A0A232FNH8_9HYME|nr:hypothetical protein TSAR_007836 [Trichomalopsis sarcophagae]